MCLRTEHWNFVRQTLIELQGEIDQSTIIVREFNTSASEMAGLPGRKSVRTS